MLGIVNHQIEAVNQALLMELYNEWYITNSELHYSMFVINITFLPYVGGKCGASITYVESTEKETCVVMEKEDVEDFS